VTGVSRGRGRATHSSLVTTDGLDPRTPVLVGVGAVRQREEHPAAALEPTALMVAALERAAADAGPRELLAQADRILVPRGFWDYPDPARVIAEVIGAPRVRTLVAEVGVLQSTILAGAASAVLSGEARVVLVAGGEAKYRALRALLTGIAAPITRQADGIVPDDVLRPHQDVLHPVEMARGFVLPVAQFAMIEQALRHEEGLDATTHHRRIGSLWAGFNRAAADNPVAWSPEPLSAEEIVTPSARNPMIAFPYTKRLTSQWNVDQAAGLIFCSLAVARELGIPESRWVFPWAVAESNHMLPLVERPLVCRSPGFAVSGERVAARTGIAPAEADLLDLYSCFPAAVRLQCRELGIGPDRSLTVTGGMTFAGGPLNNFVLQAMVRMAERLRAAPGCTGLVTAVSGVATKQGVTLWASRPPERPFSYDDVGSEVARMIGRVPVDGERTGAGRVVATTVLHDRGEPSQGVALIAFADGTRNLAVTQDDREMARLLAIDACGLAATIANDATFTLAE